MATGWKSKFFRSIEVLILVVLSILLFEYVLHPVLIDIDPMFSWQHAAGDIGGRAPDSPAGAALAITFAIIWFGYSWVKYRVDVYITGER